MIYDVIKKFVKIFLKTDNISKG